MASKKEETALAVVQKYAVMTMEHEDLNSIIKDNLGTGGLSQWDLDKVKVPSGGATSWEVPTLEGTESVKALKGVIVFWKPVRAFYREEYSGGNEPPSCFSDDGKVGIGDPYGTGEVVKTACQACPNNAFGTARKGGGKACGERILLFLIREGDRIPLMINLPPTSQAVCRKYFLRLVNYGKPFFAVVTEITLEKTKNADGIDYSVASFKVLEHLDDDARNRMEGYSNAIAPVLSSVTLDEADLRDDTQ